MTKTEIAEKSEQMREARITDLAKAAGVGKSHMSLIMSGKRTPSLPVAKRIADKMRISLGELYERLNAAA